MRKYYKTELHAHTSPASGCSDIPPAELVRIYKENGYDSVVITNHFTSNIKGKSIKEKIDWYLDDYYKCLEAGKEQGLNVILGAEVRLDENINDYLVYGINPDDLFDIYNMLSYGIDRFYREYKNDKNVIIQAHPMRDKITFVKPESLDGIEAFNLHPNHNSRVGLAAKFARENDMIAICGSDFHHYGQECLCGILTKKPLTDSFDVANILKKRAYDMSVSDYVIRL